MKQPGHVLLPREASIARYGHRFVRDEVTEIDTAKNRVRTASGQSFDFDACIVAAGSERNFFGVDGADRYSIGLRTVADAQRIADRLVRLAGRNRRASIVVVGGGISGLETVGELLRREDWRNDFTIHVVEQADRLFPSQPEALSDDALRRLAPCPVEIHSGLAVVQVTPRRAVLSDGAALSADLCIWTAGLALPSFLAKSELADGGWLPVSQCLQSTVAGNVFVAGDCAELPEPLPKQAYHALDMGETAGQNVMRYLGGEPLQPFKPAAMPVLIALGDLTTWLVAGQHVVASPLLAAAKEGVYQVNMAQLASPWQPIDYVSGITGRICQAANALLRPQLTPAAVLRNLLSTRIVG